MKKNNFYITTPIYYPSASPHMGHAYSSILADVFARFKRLDNFNVFFLTGTDEHGLKIQKAAQEKNQNPKDFCDQISKTFKNLSKILNLSNDDFIRTTEKRHYLAVQDLWSKLENSGDIYLSKYKGWYSVSDEAYYSDNEIIEKKGIKISSLSGSKVDWVEEESYFFKLSKWQDKLLNFYDINKNFILPLSRRNEVINFVKSGLKDLSVSRTSFSWGIPVPSNKKHVIYVWLDALTNYISALNYPKIKDNNLFNSFWPASLHIIGKDILRFHAIYWPAFLLAANIKPPERVYGHGWILSGEEKMSKSKGNILDPIELVEKYGLDSIRYYLMKEVSLGHDGSITKKNLENCINSDLANSLGNLCQRILSFIKNNCNNKVPKYKKFSKEDNALIEFLPSNIEKLRNLMNKQEINSYLKIITDITFNANKYINDMEPWKLKKTNTDRMNTVLYVSLECIRKISIFLLPFIPDSSTKILNSLNVDIKLLKLDSIKENFYLKPGNKLNDLDILFKKF